MFTFSQYQMEAVGHGMQAALEYIKKNKMSVKKTAGNTIDVGVDGDRIEFLKKIANDLGGKYNPTGGSSSIGRTELDTGVKIQAKPMTGGGSGAGAAVTRTTESAQCAYLAAAYYANDFSEASITKVKAKFDTDESLKNILTKVPPQWEDSCILTAEVFKKKYPNKGYVFHRGSSWVDELENHWKKLNRQEREFSNLNKWSPADIYAVSNTGARIKLTDAKTILELNQMMKAALQSKDIIGISLKQVKGTAKIAEKNVEGKATTYKFESLTLGLRGFFASQDGYLNFNGGRIQFRRFGTTWQGEIKGKTANMGKISGGPIVNLMKRNNIKIKPQKDITKKTPSLMKEFYKFYKNFERRPITYDDFEEEVNKKDMNWYISKWLTAQLLFNIDKQRKSKKDDIVSEMIGYAASESQLSGPYIKIS